MKLIKSSSVLIAALCWVQLVALSGCKTTAGLQAEKVQYASTPVSAREVGKDSLVENMLSGYRSGMEAKMNRVIGRAETELIKGGRFNTLGNFVADAVRNQSAVKFKTPVHLSLVNLGGIRINDLSAGDITLGRVYEIMPFDNLVLLYDLSGVEVQALLNHFAAIGGAAVSGVSFTIKNKQAQNVTVNNEPLSPGGTYTFAISDYLANGGDDLQLLKNKTPRNINYLQRDAIADEIVAKTAAGSGVRAVEEQRVLRNN